MPFKSDAQRRYLWSQKPEVAKKFAKHHQDGGPISLTPEVAMDLNRRASPRNNPNAFLEFLKKAGVDFSKDKKKDIPKKEAPPAPKKKKSLSGSAEWNVPLGDSGFSTYGKANTKGDYNVNLGYKTPVDFNKILMPLFKAGGK